MDPARENAATGRPWARIALLAGAGCLLAGAVFFGGGSGNGSVPVLGGLSVVVAAVAVAAASLGVIDFPTLDRTGRLAAAAGCGLVAWTGISIGWSIAGDRSWDALNKGLAGAAFAIVGLALAGCRRRGVRDVALVLAAVLGAALVWALAGKAIPSLFPDGGRATRLRNPVGYWNGLALLADAAIPLGLWLGASVRGRIGRPGGALLVYAAVLTIMLTQSRAGLLAGLVVVGLWLCLARERIEGALLALLATTPAAAVCTFAFTRPALVEDGATRADRVSDGRLFGVLALAGALVAVALALRVPVDRLAASRRRVVVSGLVGGLALLTVAGAIGLVAAVGNPFTWAVDQVSGSAGTEVENDPSRFTTLNANNRQAWWGEAWEIFRAQPMFGTGAHTFELARKPYRDDARNVTEPHSVPMQLLADTGLVGFALGAMLAVALAVAGVAALRRLDLQERAAACALAALPAAYALHALVDYDLDFLALTGPALLVAGLLVGAGRPAVRMPGGWLPASLAAVAAIAVVGSLATPELSRRGVDAAYSAIDNGDLERAGERARAARDLNPLSPEPLWALADVEQAAGDNRLAVAYRHEATELQPENPDTWYMLGLAFQIWLDDQCRAYTALNHAYTLDPRSSRWEPGGPLDSARDAVNDDGACEPQP